MTGHALEIAVIGMAGRFPGARNIDEFWRNLANGTESISRLSDEEMLAAGVPAYALCAAGYVNAAPVLDQPGHFDAAFFGYSPMEARTIDPQHRILLELAYEALEHSGHDPGRYDGRVGIFAGSALNTYFTSVGLSERLADNYIPTLIGNDKDFIATRISYKLDLRGPSLTVQSACSSSLVAVHLACQSLLTEETDMALAGAISVRVPHRAGYLCDSGGVVSPDGHVRAFDARANGTVFGSGGGVLVLKRLRDAIADRDTIHAIIKGSAVNNDGAAKAGYTAPSVDGQADVVTEAFANAAIDADSIGYIEAHGSGTPVGDPVEIRALTKAFRASTHRRGYCAIGSVKTNVGHLDAAAGVAGAIKAILALKHQQIPASLHFGEPNPEIDFASTPFYVPTRLQKWKGNAPRRAGVMSTGMGGTNAHIVLEEPPAPAITADDRPPHLLVLSARTESALDEVTLRLRQFLEDNERVSLGDVAHTLRVGRRAFGYRRCVVCADRLDAIRALSAHNTKATLSGRTEDARRPVVLLLPGIGDHYVGMGRGLYDAWPVFREEADRCAAILEPHLGVDIRSLIYPIGRRTPEPSAGGIDLKRMLARDNDAASDPDTEKLDRTVFSQPALFTIEYATTRLWQSLGVTPDAIVGHSMGEYVAACISGVLSLEDALRLIAVRAKLVSELPLGGMLAVALPEQELVPLLPAELSLSVINGPRLCVVAGPPDALTQFEERLNGLNVVCRRVRNAHAFHSRMLEPIAEALEAEAAKVRFGAPSIPYISNVSGTWISASDARDPAYWAKHATRPARFSDALRALWQFTNPVLLEAGPGRTLGVLAAQHPDRGDAPTLVSSIRHEYENEPDVDFLWRSIGRLWVSGIQIDWDSTPAGSHHRRVPLPTYPFERQLHWLGPVPPRQPDTSGKASVRKNPNRAEWLYAPSWKRTLPRAIGTDVARHQRGRYLVYADACDFAARLSAKLQAAGHDVVTVRRDDGYRQIDSRTFTIAPQAALQCGALIGELLERGWVPDRIVHAWSVTGSADMPSDAAHFEETQRLGFYSLLFLAKALAARNLSHDITLFVLSDRLHDVSGVEPVCAEKAPLLGPCMVIRQEYPNVRVQSLDVDAHDDPGSCDRAVDLVLREFADPDSSPCVAHRNGQRWIQAYEPVQLPEFPKCGSQFRTRGVYLITGGLGKVGIALSEYLAEQYQARLVLLGRSALPVREEWDAWVESHAADDPVRTRIEAIRRVETLGAEVIYADVDVADIPSLRAAVDQAVQRFGALHGVVHAAGVIGPGAHLEIKDCDPASCEAAFRAKAGGVLALRTVLEGMPLDFCLLISSMASVLGGIGHATYAASNLYLDAFALRQNRVSMVPWLSVNSDFWRLDAEAAPGTGLGATLNHLGMNRTEATATIETVLAARRAGRLLVSTGDLDARINQWVKLESLDVQPAAVDARTAISETRAQPDALADPTEQRVAQIWQAALGVEAVGANETFAELGGHSLLAIRIVSELRKAFRIDLAVRTLFDAPTVAQLSRHIREQVAAEIESLTEQEAQSLLAQG